MAEVCWLYRVARAHTLIRYFEFKISVAFFFAVSKKKPTILKKRNADMRSSYFEWEKMSTSKNKNRILKNNRE